MSLLPTAGPAPAAAKNASDSPESRRAELAQRLAEAQQSLRMYQAQRAVPPDDLLLEIELLKWIDLTCSQRQSAEERAKLLEERLVAERSEASVAEQAADASISTGSFVELEDARDTLDDERSRRHSLDLEITAARGLVQSAKESQSSCEKQRRLAREKLERCTDEKSRGALVRQLDLAQLKSQAIEEAVRQREEELRLYKAECAISELRLQTMQKKLDRMESCARFTPEELQNQLALLDQAEAEIRREIAAAENRLRQSRSATPQAASPRSAVSANEADQTAQWHQESLSLLQQSLQDLFLKRILWKRRFDLVHRLASADELIKWQSEARDFSARLVDRKELIQIRLQNHTNDLASLRSRPTGEVATLSNAARITEVDRLVSFYTNHLHSLQADERLLTRFQKEIASLESKLPASQWLAEIRTKIRELWNYELTSVNDRPITVAKIICGVILLITGFVFSRISSAIFRRRVVPRLKLDDGAAAAVQSIVFYVVLLCSTLFSLELVHLPLTAFTFMGGAVAIGIGFGSQNVLSNFISGLILLVERPVRVGDVVHIDGLNGTVDAIGARSTRLRTGSNFEIMVPNSKFLENTVTNWTLSDARIRTMVGVGVAYGSNTREVEQLLQSIVQQRTDVFQHPEPIVVFKDFGDNTLLFEIHFWIDARAVMGGELIKSEIRHTIDETFRESRISIAYPQRDVHLDVQSPIQVQVHSAARQSRNSQHLRAA
jgi:small-conductance mechanosensitive channel